MPPMETSMLTDTQVKNLKPKDKEYKVLDRDGLYIYVTIAGSKKWRYRYKVNGKPTSKTLGTYPNMSIKEAREERDKYKDREVLHSNITLLELSEKYFDHKSSSSTQYLLDNRGLLKNHVGFLNMTADDVKPKDIISCLSRLNDLNKLVAARKLGGLLNRIYRYGVTLQLCNNNPVQNIDFCVLIKQREEKNFPGITDIQELRALVKLIKEAVCDEVTKAALLFLAHTFVRPQNIRSAELSDVDLDNRLWKIPGEKMKRKRDHLVPLSDAAISILANIKRSDSAYVFHSQLSKTRRLSENTLNYTLIRLGYKGIHTAHGFRRSASTILHENKHIHGVHRDAIEMQLAHKIKGIEGVYNKAEYIEQRIDLMNWWSDLLEG